MREQVTERIACGRLEPSLTADRRHFIVQIDAASRNPALAQQIEELAPPASDIKHIVRAFEQAQYTATRSRIVVLDPENWSSKPTYL